MCCLAVQEERDPAVPRSHAEETYGEGSDYHWGTVGVVEKNRCFEKSLIIKGIMWVLRSDQSTDILTAMRTLPFLAPMSLTTKLKSHSPQETPHESLCDKSHSPQESLSQTISQQSPA